MLPLMECYSEGSMPIVTLAIYEIYGHLILLERRM